MDQILGSLSSRKPIRVLLVGSGAEFRKRLETFLAGRGLAEVVGRLSSGRGVFHLITSLAPDLVLVDGTGGLDALEVVHQAKTRREPPPVVILAEQVTSDLNEQWLAVGADHCVDIAELENQLPPIITGLQTGVGSRPSDNSLPASQRKPLVFVVDDEVELANLTAMCLRLAGYEARVFHSGLDVLQALAVDNLLPRVLVTDFQMPGINGLELIRRSKAICPRLKTISASGRVTEDHFTLYGVHPDFVLKKPYYAKDLLTVVASALQGGSAEEAGRSDAEAAGPQGQQALAAPTSPEGRPPSAA